MLKLDASSTSRLEWEGALWAAQKLAARDMPIVWHLDFQFESASLEDEAYIAALQLSAQHFKQTIWPHYPGDILLYEGPLEADVPEKIVPCLKEIASALPLDAPCFLKLDTTCIPEAVTYFRRTARDLYGTFEVIFEGEWLKRYPIYHQEPLALLLPQQRDFSSLLDQLNTSFRVIPESLLTQQWDGVDDLIVFSDEVTPKIKRKLLGFCAAEGRVITVGETLGLPHEILFSEFRSTCR